MRLEDDIISIKGIGDKTRTAFSKLGIHTVKDLVFYYPRTYKTYSEPVSVRDVSEGDRVAVFCKIVTYVEAHKGKRYTITSLSASDDTGTIRMVWFNMPFLKSTFHKGESYVFYVDNTPPKASLEIEGLKEKKEYLNKDPLIKYGGEDELSGLEEGKAFLLKINGTEYKNANGKTLSQIIGSINDSTKYTVELTVTDRAGKNTVIEKSFFVDVTGPDITVTKSKPGKYINSSVEVTVLVKDNNLDKNSISISA